jgi:hypothetical protein
VALLGSKRLLFSEGAEELLASFAERHRLSVGCLAPRSLGRRIRRRVDHQRIAFRLRGGTITWRRLHQMIDLRPHGSGNLALPGTVTLRPAFSLDPFRAQGSRSRKATRTAQPGGTLAGRDENVRRALPNHLR